MSKNKLRKLYQHQILTLSSERKKQASKAACESLYKLSENAKVVASFSPKETEIEISPFNLKMIEQKRLVLPKVSETGLIFYSISSYEELEKSKWNVLEPKDLSCPIAPSDITIIFIPALCFDPNNYRLGRGKGFYDHFLSLNPFLKSIGVGYKEQLLKSPLPKEPHDQKLSQVLLF